MLEAGEPRVQPDSPAEHPEKLYKERKLMVATCACTTCMLLCLTVNMPWLERLFPPTAPVSAAYGQTK